MVWNNFVMHISDMMFTATRAWYFNTYAQKKMYLSCDKIESPLPNLYLLSSIGTLFTRITNIVGIIWSFLFFCFSISLSAITNYSESQLYIVISCARIQGQENKIIIFIKLAYIIFVPILWGWLDACCLVPIPARPDGCKLFLTGCLH